MHWSPEFRLKLIKAIASRNIGCVHPETDPSWHAAMQRILFLAEMPDEFLERNADNFIDAIRWATEETA